MNMLNFYYGFNNNFINITDKVMRYCFKDNIIYIPSGDNKRAEFFGDPLIGTLKEIKIEDQIYKDDEEIKINIIKLLWELKIKFISNSIEKLNILHNFIHLDFGNIKDEYNEQLMSIQFINKNSKVLEIGGNIGRNSCIIASILKDDSNLVVMECNSKHATELEQNRNNNGFKFHIEDKALSKRKLIYKGWETIPSNIIFEDYKEAKTITFDELIKKYGNFDTLVLDCEGAFYYILMDEPNILNTINLIIMENDYTNIEHKNYIDNILKEKNFSLIYNKEGPWGPCSNCFYQVFKK